MPAPPVQQRRRARIQHAAPQVVERINTYFGFRVRRLKLVQAPLPPAPAPPAPPQERPLAPAEQEALQAAVAEVEDGPLQEALLGLGRSLLAVRR